MARVIDVMRVRAPRARVMGNAELPAEVAAPLPTVIVEEAVAGLGLKLAVAPPGNPLTVKITAAVKPPEGVMLTAYVRSEERRVGKEGGAGEWVKSGTGAGLMVRVTDVVRVRVPLTTVIVKA